MLSSGKDAEFYLLEKFLYDLGNKGFKLGLERMLKWSALQGDPHTHFPIIHVAGTNGKGSVCAMLEAIYRNAGYTTGLFTSPHLVELGERIQVNREHISRQSILEFTRLIKQTAMQIAPTEARDHPTFFEYITMMAFEYFKAKKVDIAIIETGLGGRLDSTNIVKPELSIITTIGLDHMEWLGNTLGAIAREKAGIIKHQTPVVIGDIQGEALEVIAQKAKDMDSPLFSTRGYFGEPYEGYPQPSLAGNYQRHNAATAYLAAKALASKLPIKDSNIIEGLNTVHWAGRWQHIKLPQNKTIIVDTTHNEAGLSALRENLDAYVKQYGQKPTIITGSISDYRAKACVTFLSNYAARLYLSTCFHEKAISYQNFLEYVPKAFSDRVEELTASKLVRLIENSHPDAPIVITGSIYLIGDVLKNIGQEDKIFAP